MKPEQPLRNADRPRGPEKYPHWHDSTEWAKRTTMTRSKFAAMTPKGFASWCMTNSEDCQAFFYATKWPEGYKLDRKVLESTYEGLKRHPRNWPTVLLDKIEPEVWHLMDYHLPQFGMETPEEAEQRRLDFRRCSGICVCEACLTNFRDHPLDAGDETYDGHPVLRVLCDLSRVKL